MRVKLFSSSIKAKLKEMEMASSFFGLRSALKSLSSGYYSSPTSPVLRDTKIKKNDARALYFNTNPMLNKGAFLARPIVDSTADYIGIPRLSTQNDDTDVIINNWVTKFWKKQLWEMYKNSLREADTWVRLRKPFPSPLISSVEEDVIELEVYDSDRVTPYYNPVTNQLSRVEILTKVYIEDAPFDPNLIYATGLSTHGREHEIIEIVTPNQFMYYDATEATYLDEYTIINDWGFVPLVQVFNDFDSALNGGVSELETVFPFFHILHELITQTQIAFKNVASPKLKFKLADVSTFLSNNFPDSYVDGKFTGKVSWKNSDIFFLEDNDDAEFIIADMGINDASIFMEFIIDCICIASETPQSMIYRAGGEGLSDNNEYERFKVKINRKRAGVEEYISTIIKMALKIDGKDPLAPGMTWDPIQLADLLTEAQAINSIVTAAEVANRAKTISRRTYRAKIKPFFPDMLNDAAEDEAIQNDMREDNEEQVELQKQLNAVTPGGDKVVQSAINSTQRKRALLAIDPIPVQTGE